MNTKEVTAKSSFQRLESDSVNIRFKRGIKRQKVASEITISGTHLEIIQFLISDLNSSSFIFSPIKTLLSSV